VRERERAQRTVTRNPSATSSRARRLSTLAPPRIAPNRASRLYTAAMKALLMSDSVMVLIRLGGIVIDATNGCSERSTA
jgi:hypothetical protein